MAFPGLPRIFPSIRMFGNGGLHTQQKAEASNRSFRGQELRSRYYVHLC